MNLTELKKDFYKRYEESEKFMHFTSCGLLCTLLGHTDIETAPSLTCTLSMRVQMFARKLGGQQIQIESTMSDESLAYIFDTPAELFRDKDAVCIHVIKSLEKYGLKGAEILYENSKISKKVLGNSKETEGLHEKKCMNRLLQCG